MVLPAWCRDTVTILRPDIRTDRIGDQVLDWSTPTRIPLPGCSVQSAGSAEDTVDRQQTTDRRVLLAPPGADIGATDRIQWAGVDYDVDGPLEPVTGATGALAHVRAELVAVKG